MKILKHLIFQNMNKTKQWHSLGLNNLLQKVISLNNISDENIRKYVRFMCLYC